MPSSSNKIALFIDGANLYATAKTLGFDIDYKRLLKEFQSRGTLLRAFYYTAIIEDQEYLVDPPADRLAGLQRLHRRHQGDQGIHRRQRPPQGEGQHGHRACGRCHGAGRACRPDRAVLWRRRLPPPGGSGAAPRRPRHRRLDHLQPAADDRGRAAARRPTSSPTSSSCSPSSAATLPNGRPRASRAITHLNSRSARPPGYHGAKTTTSMIDRAGLSAVVRRAVHGANVRYAAISDLTRT